MAKLLTYFLCFSFLLMTSHTPWIIAEAKENASPVGEMVSKGTVKFEVRENVWRPVESTHFPIFKGTKIKTENGHAILTLPDTGRIEVNPKSLFSFDKEGRLVLTGGGVQFHLPMASDISFKVGNLSINRARTLQAAKGSSASPAIGPFISGSITVHANGSVTVKTEEGKLQVSDQDNVLLAAIPKNESVTIPSVTVSGPPRVMVAQAGETSTTTETTGTFLGISTWGWVAIIAAGAGIGGVIAIAGSGGGGGGGAVPICR